ncbi:MAG: DUF748 domain-containing protein [Deltaproteobacteria bacterium]
MSGNGKRSSIWKWLLGAAGAVVVLGLLLAALVAFVVPGLVQTQAAKGMEAATGRKLAIGTVSIHPFTWRVEIGDVTLSEVGGKGTFASFQRGEATVSPGSILRGAPVISHVRLVKPHFDVVRTGPSTYNFSDLLKYLTMPVPALSLEDVAITEGSIDFTDRAFGKAERHTVRNAELMVPFLTTVPARAAEYGNPRFKAEIDGSPLVIETQVRGLPRAPEVSAKIDLKDLSLPVYLSYFPADVPVKVDSGKVNVQGTASYRITPENGGEVGWDGALVVSEIRLSEHQGPLRVNVDAISVRSRVAMGEKRGLLLEDGALEIKKFTVPFGKTDGMTLGLLSVTGARFSEKQNRVDVESVLLSDGDIRISRDRQGVFSPMPLLEHLQAKLPKTRESAGKPIEYRVKKIEGKGLDLAFQDGTRKELPAFRLSGASFQASDVTGPLAGPIAFTFGARFGKDATIQARGKAVPTPLAADAVLEVRGLALADGAAYLPDGLGITIADGRLDLTLAVDVATRNDKLGGTYGGTAAVRSLKLVDGKRARLAAWRDLTIHGVKGTLEPMTLRVEKVSLAGLRADLVMDKDGNLNLPGGTAPAAGQAAQPAPKKPSSKVQPDTGFEKIQVDEVVVSDGGIDFTDRGVPGEFHASIKDISVRLTGISSEPGKAADIRARMVLPKGAPLTITGKAALLKKPMVADLDLVLEKLDLSTATPYSGTYLGLEIDRGDLTVKSHARIENGKLAAEDRIRVDQLEFGKSVKSDKATILPVQLIIDILRDKNGDIVLDLPLSAKTDDDNLVGTLVLQAAGEVVFPPGSPVRSITFAGCSAGLDDDAQGRLRKLAGALQDRPAMRVVAHGFVDRDSDGKACQALPPPAVAVDADTRMRQLAQARAVAVRDFLVQQGAVEAARVSATTGDVYAPPRQKGDRQARVDFSRATD